MPQLACVCVCVHFVLTFSDLFSSAGVYFELVDLVTPVILSTNCNKLNMM